MKKFILALALVSAPVLAQDRVAKLDVNGDKAVDLVELRSACNVSKALFERADKNSDGVLSNNELRSAKGYLFSRCDEKKDV